MSDNHTRPINKQAAIFLSKKARVETVQEALDIFAQKVCDPQVARSIQYLLKKNDLSDSPVLSIRVNVRRDARSPGMYTVSLKTSVSSQMADDGFDGLTI